MADSDHIIPGIYDANRGCYFWKLINQLGKKMGGLGRPFF